MRVEADWIRPLIKAALRDGGLDLYPASVEDSLVDCAVSLLVRDRATSAEILHMAAQHYEGQLDSVHCYAIAQAIEHREEPTPGEVLHDPGHAPFMEDVEEWIEED